MQDAPCLWLNALEFLGNPIATHGIHLLQGSWRVCAASREPLLDAMVPKFDSQHTTVGLHIWPSFFFR
jgi:hypothetical protein